MRRQIFSFGAIVYLFCITTTGFLIFWFIKRCHECDTFSLFSSRLISFDPCERELYLTKNGRICNIYANCTESYSPTVCYIDSNLLCHDYYEEWCIDGIMVAIMVASIIAFYALLLLLTIIITIVLGKRKKGPFPYRQSPRGKISCSPSIEQMFTFSPAYSVQSNMPQNHPGLYGLKIL